MKFSIESNGLLWAHTMEVQNRLNFSIFLRFFNVLHIRRFMLDVNIGYFYTDLNTLHLFLDFTIETSNTQLLFLYVFVEFNYGYISTDIHSKATATTNCLKFNLCHRILCSISHSV